MNPIPRHSRLWISLLAATLIFMQHSLIPPQAFAAKGAGKSQTALKKKPRSGPSELALGIMIGEPTGLNAKFRRSPEHAVDIGLSYSSGNYIEIISDYFWNFPQAFANASRGSISTDFVPYLGIGVAALFNTAPREDRPYRGRTPSDTAFGPRIPMGMDYLPKTLPLGFFAEIAPGTILFPDSYAFVEGGIGARIQL